MDNATPENLVFDLDTLMAPIPGHRKAIITELQLVNSGLGKEAFLHMVGIDPDQPYSETAIPERQAWLFVQPPLEEGQVHATTPAA